MESTPMSFLHLYNNITSQSCNNSQSKDVNIPIRDIVIISIIFSIEIPMTLMAIFVIISLIKSNQTSSVFVMNLLIADLIQIVSLLLFMILIFKITILADDVCLENVSHDFSYDNFSNSDVIFHNNFKNILTLFIIGVWVCITSLYLMICIAIERYIMIAHPIWHESHRSIKCLVCSALTGWLLPFIIFPLCLFIHPLVYIIPFIPFPMITLCFVLVCWSLFKSTSLTSLNKGFVLAPVFFVQMIYTFFILPLQIFLFLYVKLGVSADSLGEFILILYMLKPIGDSLLCVFIRSDAETIICTPQCCSKPKTKQGETQNAMITIEEQRGLNKNANGIDSSSSAEYIQPVEMLMA